MIKVLIVEDEPLLSKMYTKALSPQEFQVTAVNNSTEGIEKAKLDKPDLILLDIMMPEPNGIQALHTLKSDPVTHDIPVVMLTNVSDKLDISYTTSQGAIDYWIKSEIDVETLGDKIKGVL